ncbi:MAG: DUF4159 domain-containing protein [Pirellulaceae bacterium]
MNQPICLRRAGSPPRFNIVSVVLAVLSVVASPLLMVSRVDAQVNRGRGIAPPGRWGEVDAETVNKAIERARSYLLENQLDDGGWPEFNSYPYGVSALVTLALLNSGLDPEERHVARALQLLDGANLEKTYSVAVQTMAFCAANPKKYAAHVRRNAVWLIKAQRGDGGWNYDGSQQTGSDPSNSQFALLALHEAQRTGLKFAEPEIWNEVFTKSKLYWQRIQFDNGSFPYRTDARGSMTCAGIASLVIAGAQTDGLEASADQTIECCGADDGSKDGIERGLEWLARNFSVRNNPNFPSRYHLYYMYALERVGRLTGRRYIGEHDWYREGAAYLINFMQDKINGKFTGVNMDGNEFTETAFALLFLSKGKRQIVVNRLQYPSTDPQDWNHHSKAVQHLTAHTEQAWKRDLSWQNIDLQRSSLKDLLETPVLFISGTQVPRWSQQQKSLLKEYVEQGGFIFFEGCNRDGCNGQAFESYVRKLVVDLFDQPLEPLSPDHPIWYAQGRVDPEGLPAEDANIYGVQTCCRLGVVYVPYSLSCRWELNLPYGAKPDYDSEIQKDLDTATLIGMNILAYATGKELKEKLDAVSILEKVDAKVPTDRGVFFLPKIKHNAGFDDAAKSVTNLVEWLNKTKPFRMSSEKRAIAITKSNFQDTPYPVVYIHGRGELRLSQTERDVLKNYLDNGGFLIGDAICADRAFAESFQREMEIITGKPLENLPANHRLLTGDGFQGFNIQTVRMIDPDQSGENIDSATRRIMPRLQYAKVDRRVAVLFSPLDLSCALESKHSLQCRGYVREDAARIGINMILFARLQ